MRKNIKEFKYKQMGTVRVVVIDGTEYFVAKEVIMTLKKDVIVNDINWAVRQAVPQKERNEVIWSEVYGEENTISSGNQPLVILITLTGLFDLLTNIELENRADFCNWVLHYVLPEVRKFKAGLIFDEKRMVYVEVENSVTRKFKERIQQLEKELDSLKEKEDDSKTFEIIIDNIEDIEKAVDTLLENMQKEKQKEPSEKEINTFIEALFKKVK